MIWHGFGAAYFIDPDYNMLVNQSEKSLLYNISDGTWSLQNNEVVSNVTLFKIFASAILGTYEALGLLYQITDLNLHDLQDLTNDIFIHLVVRICH